MIEPPILNAALLEEGLDFEHDPNEEQAVKFQCDLTASILKGTLYYNSLSWNQTESLMTDFLLWTTNYEHRRLVMMIQMAVI